MPDAPVETKVCPKCGGVMESGFNLDTGTLGSGWDRQQRWTASLGQSFLGGGRKVSTFACTQCGFLESYLEPKS